MSRPAPAPRKRTPEHRVYLARRDAQRRADQRRVDQAARRLVTWARSA